MSTRPTSKTQATPVTSQTVRELIEHALPLGTRVLLQKPRRSWREPPDWPPNLYAVAALLIERLDLLAWWDSSAPGNASAIDLAQLAGIQWRDRSGFEGAAPARRVLVDAWRDLLSRFGHRPLASLHRLPQSDLRELTLIAVALVAIADEASAGVGFGNTIRLGGAPSSEFWVTKATRLAAGRRARKSLGGIVPALSTLTLRFNPDLGAVLPKARTPTVGCTLRSLSHHLALLPPSTQVNAGWRLQPVQSVPDGGGREPQGFNVLVIPFPYAIRPDSFYESRPGTSSSWAYFSVRPDWLPNEPEVENIVTWVEQLVDEASHQGIVHAVVFPELALTEPIVAALAKRLSSREIEFLVAGVGPENSVVAQVFHRDGKGNTFKVGINQKKHHRWKLDRGQLAGYGLSSVLNDADEYWEDLGAASEGPRAVTFHPFRNGSVLCFLICEDLARLDPCQPVVRSVGPNLVIALLMDGPQLPSRWPARYATVLAEDPGSAVLTVTSLAMSRLSERVGRPPNRSVGLWKSATQDVQQIMLADGAQAVLLSLHCGRRQEHSLDGRHDGGEACVWTLESQLSIRLSNVPPWLKI